jgi:hypothetical protein
MNGWVSAYLSPKLRLLDDLEEKALAVEAQ